MSRIILITSSIFLAPTVFGAILPDPMLMGGTASAWGRFPSTAFIRTPYLSYCGAAVVHPEFVLTLAQCVHEDLNATSVPIAPNLLDVIAGDLNIFPESYQRQSREVIEVIIHENYSSYNHKNDIALLKLDRPFRLPSNTVEVAHRRQRIVPTGTVCQLPGWTIERSTSIGGVESGQRFLALEILNRDVCNEPSNHAGRVREAMLCGGNLYQSSNAVCSGNLGSPLFCGDGDDDGGELTGLLSFGVNCGLASDPPVFTQVRFFNRWIDERIAERVAKV